MSKMNRMDTLHEPVILGNRTVDELTQQEKLRYDHQQHHEKHKGHDQMHMNMLLILLGLLTVAQILLIIWRKRHYKSYLLVTLAGMWLIPMVICIINLWWKFIFIWLLFSCITGLIARKAMEKPLQGSTPRLVYKWFLLLHKLSSVLGVIGYTLMMISIFIVMNPTTMEISLLLIFYALYYGVLSRDISELCADTMASHIGYYTPQGMPTKNLSSNVCAICGNRLLVGPYEEGIIENTYELNCKHVFHEFCIKGWCMVGKKQTCPYCKEKVDLKKMFSNVWERPHMLYTNILDWVRWMIAWQPLVFFMAQGINKMFGLE